MSTINRIEDCTCSLVIKTSSSKLVPSCVGFVAVNALPLLQLLQVFSGVYLYLRVFVNEYGKTVCTDDEVLAS